MSGLSIGSGINDGVGLSGSSSGTVGNSISARINDRNN